MKHYLIVPLALCAFLLSMSACGDDEEESIQPVTVDSVKGDFTGTLVVGSGEAVAETLTVGDDIVVADFPVDSIIKIVVPQEHFEEATATAETVDCTIGYTASVFGFNLFLELTPEPLEFDVTYGGGSHTVNAVLYTTKRGHYNGTSNGMSFELLLESVSLDGENVGIPASLSYQFDVTKGV